MFNKESTVFWNSRLIAVLFIFSFNHIYSFLDGYTTEDLVFYWKAHEPVQVTKQLNLPTFSLYDFFTDYCTSRTNTGKFHSKNLNKFMKICKLLRLFFTKVIESQKFDLFVVIFKLFVFCGFTFGSQKWSKFERKKYFACIVFTKILFSSLS